MFSLNNNVQPPNKERGKERKYTNRCHVKAPLVTLLAIKYMEKPKHTVRVRTKREEENEEKTQLNYK